MCVRVIGLIFLAVSAVPPVFSQMGGSSVFRDCPECPEMIVVPRGGFRMGIPASMRTEVLAIESPQHDLTIAYEFSVGRFEVTVGQFAAFVEDSGYAPEKHEGCTALNQGMAWNLEAERDWRSPGFQQGDNHPVVCVSWTDAKAYLDWLSKKTGKTYRLLSESEWEYVARARSRGLRHWGDSDSDACRYANVWDEAGPTGMGLVSRSDRALTPGLSIPGIGISERGGGTLRSSLGPWYRITHWCTDSHTYTAPVGKYLPNRFGLHDMIGNVWEWVEDCVNTSYIGAPSDGAAWRTGNCERRVQRGASWASVPRDTRVFRRVFRDMAFRSFDSGFRVARTM